MRNKQILKPAAILTAAFLLCGTVFAAPFPESIPATAADADEASEYLETGAVRESEAEVTGAEGEVFLSPDFSWSEETPGEFLVRFTITNRSNMMIPETEVRITLPENEQGSLHFSGEPEFSGAAPEGGSLTISGDRELRLELSDFQVGEAFVVAAGGRMGEDIEKRPESGGEISQSAGEEQEAVFRAGTMNVSLVLRGYGEEHPTSLDYRIPDLVRENVEQEEAPEAEPQVLMMLVASLTGSGKGAVTAEIVEGPLDRSILFSSRAGESVKQALAFPAEKEEPQHAVYPVTILKLLPFLAVPVTLFALYVLYCIQDVRHRAAAFRFDPMMKMRGKR